MAENEGGGGEQDDISFLRTGDIVSLTCVANREGVMGTERISLSAEGFGNRMCYLENVSDKNYPPDMAICMFNIDDALSIRALQEMMSADSEAKAGGKGGHKTLLYGHAIQLLHSQSNMYLACLSTSSSSDKLAFDVGVQESSKGEACWWTIHPASKQRSEGEKVRVGDDVILVSVATERYVHMSGSKGAMVVASFHQTLWNINPVSSGSVRTRNMGYIFGNDCVRFYHGNDEVLTIPENWSEHPQHNMVIYEGGPAVTQARSLWRLELVRMKWHGALINWEQVFRVRHMTSGRYLGLASDNQVCLLHRDKAEFDASGIIMLPAKDTKRQGIEEKEEEGMGAATLKYGENSVFLQHLHTSLWISYSTTEVTKKGIGKVEEKKAVALEEGHMDDNFTFFMALEEESKSARVIRKCSSVLNRFLRGIDGLETEGIESPAWQKVDLEEVLKLMEDLIDYFAQPADECEFEERQNCFRALRSRQDLFQEEGVLNMILDTIDKFSKMESLPDYTGLIGPGNQDTWESISTYLYLLVAAMIKGNHSNCAQFAAAQRLDWLFGRLANPQSAEGILDVLYCVLTESPEALNMIGESHIKSVISLLEKVGRDPKVLDVLSSLCEGNGVAVRSSQNTIASNLLPVKDLLLQTSLVDHTGSMMPNILVGVVEGSAWFQRWYFECEIEHVEQMTKQPPFLRVGWANTMGFIPYPGCGDMWGCNGIGDDLFSFGFDGRVMWTGGKGKPIGTRDLRKGDVIGCFLDLTLPEIRFTLNGNKMDAVFKDFNTDGFFFPVMSLSAKVSCRFILGGNQGRLRYGPPQGFSAMYEAIHGELEIVPCFSFGNLKKSTYCGPQTILNNIKPFVPEPVAVTSVNLPQYAHELHEKLAENMHELWATHKIDNGWTFAEKRSETKKQHPCLTSYDRLPAVERNYNLTQALDMLKTIYALGYHMTIDKPPTRLRPIRLPQNYQMSNGYKPAPLDSREITLDEKMLELTELLAENTHNTWAKEKIARGWTYGISEDPINKRTPHLVPYEVVIPQIKAANREGAAETIRTLMLYGLYFEAPAVEHDEAANREMEALKQIFRTYRAEKTYTVTGGKWYFEFEVLSTGFMKVGWLDASANADADLGIDDLSYGFDGYLVKKWHQGMEQYGRAWKVGDVIGCFLDLNDRTISYSMNGELLLDPSGSEMAFDNVQVGDGFLPAFTLAAGQKAKLNFGQDANSLRYFTTCGLQEGYEPFCVNMYRNMACWYGKELGLFENLGHIQNAPVQVIRVPATGNNPPCLKITHATPGTPTDKVKIEYLRISMPVRCNDVFVRNKDREDLHQNLARLRDQHRVETGQPPLLSGRFQIPKEFGSSSNLKVIKEGEKVSMTNLAPPSPKTAADKRLTLSGAKAQSFDETNVLETSTLDPPAVRSATSLQDLGMDETEDSAQRAAAVERIKELQKGDGQRSRTPLKMLQTISKKVRDVSASSRKKAEKDMPRSRSNDTPTSTLKSSRITEEVGIGRSDLPPSGPARAGTIRKTKGRSGKSPIIEIVDTSKTTGGEVPLSADDDTWEMKQMIEQIDEFYYGLRIFPGQDPAQVWVGWVTPQFHFAGQSFSLEDDVRKVCYFEKDNQNGVLEDTEYRSCYAANAQELSASVNDQSTDAKVSGLLIGCLVDTSTGELSFLANGQETGVKFKLEPSAMVYPAVFFMASSKDVCQFELGRIKYTLPLSAIIFRSSYKALTPICPPRLKLQLLRQNHWARVPDNCIRITSLRLSETRGWSVLCDDPVRMMAVYVPEKDRSFDVLELIEHSFYLAFHVQTLHLYCKLCAHGNHKVAHILCKHVEQEQLMYAIKSHHLSGQLRAGFHDMLIAVHLSYHAEARMLTTNEYLIPLLKELESKNVFSLEYESKYPAVLGQPYSILPVMAAEDVRDRIPRDVETKLQPPAFNFEALKIHVMESLADATQRAVMNCRDLIGGDNASHFEPLLKVCHTLLVMGLMTDEDIKHILMLIDPADFDPNYKAGTTQKGMIEIVLDEGVKVQLCHLLNSLCDMQLRNRVESLIAFAEGFVYELQQDQRSRYLDIKQSDMSPAEAAKKTKEFRCPPREQMDRLVNCKNKPEAEMVGEEMELEQCPMVERLQEQLRDFVGHMNKKMGCKPQEDAEAVQSLIQAEDDTSWVDTLATFVVPVPPAPAEEDEAASRRGQEAFRRMIIKAVARWAAEGVIESAELIREMFGLLIRQYNGVAEIMKALETTYIIHEVSICDVEDFIIYLNQVRSLLLVQFEWCEEETLKNALWHLMNNKVFFQHPDLMRLLRVHENVMTVMMNILTTQQAAESVTEEHSEFLAPQLRDTSDLVVSCSKFLCYFCRTSRTNQKAMFEHLSFLLDNATMLLNRPSVRGSVPLDVAYSSFMDNNELALALKEDELEKVAIYLSRCGLQPNADLIAKGYPDLGWDPVEGERYVDFLRCCVWINGESIEENANLVIRLLIRRPECLGVALKGEGQGLYLAFKEAIAMSEDIKAMAEGKDEPHGGVYLGMGMTYPSEEDEGEDYLDMGAAILQFYASLVDLLAKCAPDPLTIHEGKGESLRARAILRSLISLDDLESILSLKFTIPNVAAHPNEDISGMPPGLIPNHKKSALLFLDRVYGIADQEMFFRLLEESFLPDLRAATMLDSPKEIDIAFRLNRYLCNAVLPLLTRHAAFFADAEHEAALLDATLHTVYRMNRLKALTNTQRQAVSDFLVNITAELNPNMMIKLLTKVIVDIPALEENAMVPLKIMTLHYERCGKYYGTGNQYGVASEVEKRLSMKLFSAIFDSLGTKPYDPELFGRALPCLTAIGCALSPDYALIPVQDESEPQASDLGSAWTPKPIDVSSISLSPEITGMVDKFAEHFHDSWASRKIAKGWIHGDHYSRTDFTHPRLKPFALLQATEKKFYKERCAECVRPLLAYHYEIKLTDPDAAERAAQASHPSGNSINNYHPHPVDLSNMSLAQDMHNIAEKMSENSHLIWAKIALDDLCDRGGSMLASIVPWDLLTDFEKRKDRFRAKEVLKFLQYHGYTITNNGTDREEGFAGPAKMEVSDRAVEKRFAYNLLEKVHMYLEQAGIRMKVIKPSQDLTRRNSFKPSSKDVKFFEKVVLPLIEAYFNAHRVYFITSSAVFQAGMASNKEKELVAGLFCRLSYLLRLKNHAFGSVGKLTVTCLTVLVQAMDMRTLVKVNSDIIRTSLLTFFNHRADDLHAAVSDFKSEGQYSSLRGKNIKSWVSLEFANQMSLPILTALFQHLARSGFGTDLLVDDIQACCYKILNSLYYLANLSGHATNRAASIKAEIDKHRPPLGQCLSAFASCFPVAFLEPEFNANNKASVLSKYLEQGSVQIQEMMQNLAAHIPQLEKMMADLETAAENSVKYADSPNIFDVDLPLVCSYLSYWWQQGPEGSSQPDKQVTDVTSEHVNRMFLVVLKFLRDGVGVEDAPWLCRLPFFAVQIINYVTCDPVKNYILPIAERLRKVTENSWKEEDRLRTHPEDADEGAVAETNARLVRDVYAFMPLLVKYTDLHRAQWLKSPSWETDGIYENIAIIFKIWSRSQHFKREELNFMTQFEEAMRGGVGEPKTGGAAIADRKKKRRDGGKKDKHASSLVIQCLKRLLPVGLNVFGGRELDIVQQSKEKFLKKEGEEKIRDFIRSLLGVPEKTDPTDKNTWQRNLYHKIGKSQMRGKESMTQDGVIEKIASMGQVMSILHSVEHPANQGEGVWRKIVSSQRKRAIFACFRQTAVYCLTSYRWLADEDVGQDQLVADICEIEETSDESTVAVVSSAAAVTIGDDEDQEESKTPDALTQLVQCFQRAATSEQQQAISICDDALYNSYADVLAKSIHVAEEDGGGDDEEEVDQAEKEEEAEQLRAEQSRLADRGVATLVLQYLSASGGEPCDMVAKTLLLGINILNGGNKDVQTMMLDYQRLKRDVRFFTSLAGLMNGCSVLNLEMFERQIKAEGLGMGAELAAGEHQNLNDVDFICSLFRFLQLTCEGHNSDFQNYLRTQPGHTTSVNLINSTVDYLLRLQESIMDFYWHYSSKDMIDEGGKEHFLKAIQVCSQVFNTLTESIQGPCVGNQTTLANSRLWDAINGFFFLFAHMMDKLSKNSTQLELLREFLNLQKDMIVLMLSMLEGNVLNGPIGKQMVDALVESQQNVEMILKFFDMFLKLRDLTTSQAFMEFDLNKDGWISPKEFQKAMESQKMYSIEEINYLMMCTDVNNDGKVDYMEFTERFHNPAKDIGFNLAVLLTNLKEHIVGDPRLEKILQTAGSMLEYFDQYLGRIEIMGSAKRVEKVYFEIQEDWLEQWGKQQIRDSKNSFLFNVMQDDGGDQGKLEAFINFCEDTIFEMQHAAEISAEDSDARMERAMSQRDHFLNQSSGAHQVKEALQMGASMGLSAIDAIRPSNINAGFKSKLKAIKAMTIPQMCFQSYKTSVRTTYNIFWVLYLIVSTILRFFYFMMTSREEEVAAPAALPMPDHGRLKRDLSKGMGATIHAAMPDVHVPVPAEQSFEAFGSQDEPDAGLHARQDSSKQPTPQASMDQPTSPTPTVAEGVTSPKGTSVYETGSVYAGGSIMLPAGAPMTSVGSEDESGLFYEPKIAESAGPRSKSSPLNFLARNIKTFEAAALYLTFFLNFILLFHRVSVSEAENGNGDGGGDGDDEDEELLETVFITGITLPYGYDLTGWILGQVLYWVSVVHAIISVALLFAFYQLKVPLMTFKREKEVSRRLLFEGCWITEEEDEERSVVDTVFWYLDRIVISSTLFPAKYWDKFVRKKSGAKFSDQADEHTMNSLLGLDKTPSEDIDFRYNTWLWFGVIITNGQFLYRVGYLIASLAGVFGSPFFYATHLIDVVLSYPMLKAILQSVTHNLTQLVLTIMMTIVVVYLYAVVAFNFFRKFYVQEEEEGEEPDRKCHNMLTCFIYHFYAGVRAGGGIGDELESPYGDASMYWRMLFDITFFFFVIVILLAIMQGLIIDAFGELRSQQESATEKLESNCFVCDIGKEFFDRLPRGFENHVSKEHNFANYLFFLQHLINKDDTEYTGQETYVREMYDERNWEFFPVGECFLKQYEDTLMAS